MLCFKVFVCSSILHTHTHPFNGPMSGTTRVSRYQEGKTNLDFTEARDSEWQWRQLGTCKSAPRCRQITMPTPHHSSSLQAGCPSCRPTNSVKALKAQAQVCVISSFWVSYKIKFKCAVHVCCCYTSLPGVNCFSCFIFLFFFGINVFMWTGCV